MLVNMTQQWSCSQLFKDDICELVVNRERFSEFETSVAVKCALENFISLPYEFALVGVLTVSTRSFVTLSNTFSTIVLKNTTGETDVLVIDKFVWTPTNVSI